MAIVKHAEPAGTPVARLNGEQQKLIHIAGQLFGWIGDPSNYDRMSLKLETRTSGLTITTARRHY